MFSRFLAGPSKITKLSRCPSFERVDIRPKRERVVEKDEIGKIWEDVGRG